MKPETMTAFANALLAAPPLRQTVPAADALAVKVDRLGLIRAQIASLVDESEAIRDELEASGLAKVEGKFFSAGIAQCKAADKTDWKAIAERLGASAQLIRAHTKKGNPYTRLLLTAKTH